MGTRGGEYAARPFAKPKGLVWYERWVKSCGKADSSSPPTPRIMRRRMCTYFAAERMRLFCCWTVREIRGDAAGKAVQVARLLVPLTCKDAGTSGTGVMPRLGV